MTQKTKEHLVSAVLTFFTGFFPVIILNIESLNLQAIETGALSGVMLAGLRAGLKLLLEDFLKKRL